MSSLFIGTEIIMTVIQSLIIGKFLVDFNEFPLKTGKNKICFLGISAVIAVTILLFNILGGHFEGWLGLFYPVLYLTLSLIFFNGTLQRKIIGSLAAITGVITANTIIFVYISSLTGDPGIAFSSGNIFRGAALVAVQVLLILIYRIIIQFVSKHTIKLSFYEWALISVNILFALMMFISLIIIKTNEGLSGKSNLIVSGLLLGLIIINFITFYMMLKLNKNKEILNENILLKQQSVFEKTYADNVKEAYDEVKRLRHDMKHSYVTIASLLHDAKYEELHDYLGEYNNESGNTEILVNTKNEYVNAIINTKLRNAKSKGIKLMCVISDNFTGIGGVDLCNLLGNILDNAIEAAEKCAEPIIDITIHSDDEKLSVCVKNTALQADCNGELRTSKKNKDFHGFGVKTIKRIADEYKGKSDFYMEDDMFCCYVELKRKCVTD